MHYKSNNHTGVAHLAERFAKTLATNQKYLNISEEDILCVKIAGLCHDLGECSVTMNDE